MRHEESDLRELLTVRAEAGQPSVSLDAIVRRGRRIRRKRRALASGVAAAVAAVVLVNGLPRTEGPPVAAEPPDSAVVDQGPELPATFPVRLGGTRVDLTLAHPFRFDTVGATWTVIFEPTSHWTSYRVVCDDPRAWVVTSQRLKGGETGGTAARCDGLLGGHHDKLSTPSDWLRRPQSIRVWVFPADAPVREVAQEVTGCPSPAGECDESAQEQALMNADVRERLLARVGERPGNWAIGIYDRPAAQN
ncbi:hypothetical protein [Nonomuraea candida]|uniref:hypothetical protein n=1 Tax=Nonomuraea candida TaxID=359159 RepID=UPI0005BDCF56|nr:hypothetical protein [Nonomuraea candida]